jgi:thiamine biosynthesis lipoprotein
MLMLFKTCHILLILILSACSQLTPTQIITDSIFGTTYTIKVVAPITANKLSQLTIEIKQRLEQIDAAMSSWRSDSQINLFNNSPINQWMQVSVDTYKVIKIAQHISQLTKGSFDITTAPLVKLWGFKEYQSTSSIPSDAEIIQALKNIGFTKLQLDDATHSIRKLAPIRIDLAAIAKGYAVDVISELLLTHGYDNHLVEIGGEIKLNGMREGGNKWRLAIEQPQELEGSIAKIITLTNAALATSGDYRNYFVAGGTRYSHSIDPNTGYPISHNLASVTVIDSSSARADALATALTIMGIKQGLVFAQANNIAALFIIRDRQHFKQHYTSAFLPFIAKI